ncbi:MAG TPA: SPFH domain-containing protein [Flavipsychrobacter sp.]|jgi:regulator of protease activity HflC (stomatin/prohibitin superfamily)|nr:SPFH domain-containing protein [Flavipsychrobacter sp.]
MITLVIVVIGLLIAFFKFISTTEIQGPKYKKFTTPATIFAIFLLIALVNPFVVKRVDAGHVGIKVNLTGDNRGVSKFEYKTGWVIYNTWISKLYEFPTFQQHIDFPEQSVITKGGFEATIKPSFNYSLNPGSIGDMFQNLRLSVKEVEQGWLKNAIISSVNDVANLYEVDAIFNHRAEFENAIIQECNKRVGKWFNISQLRTNIQPPQALREAIEKKTKAIQEAQAAENQKFVAIAEAERKIAVARGDSAAAVIEAAGEAEAIRRKQLSLTPTYVEFIRVQKWDGKYPTTVAGSGTNMLFQLPSQK